MTFRDSSLARIAITSKALIFDFALLVAAIRALTAGSLLQSTEAIWLFLFPSTRCLRFAQFLVSHLQCQDAPGAAVLPVLK